MKFVIRYHYRREMFSEKDPDAGIDNPDIRAVGGFDAYFEASLSGPALPRQGETFEMVMLDDCFDQEIVKVRHQRIWEKWGKGEDTIPSNILHVVELETDVFRSSFHDSTLPEVYEEEAGYVRGQLTADLKRQGFKLVLFTPWGHCESL